MALPPLAALFSTTGIQNHFPLSVLGSLRCTSKFFSSLLSDSFILQRARTLHFTSQNPQGSLSSEDIRIFKRLFPIFRQGLKELHSDLTAAKPLDFKTPSGEGGEGQIHNRRLSWCEDLIEHGQDLLFQEVIKNQWVTETGDLPAENLSQLRVSLERKDDLEDLLHKLARRGRLESVLAIIEGPWFSHIDKAGFGLIFYFAAKYGHLACIKALIQKNNFDTTFQTNNHIGSACVEVANNKRHDCLVEIVNFKRIDSSGYFREAVEAIIKQGYDDCLKIMVLYPTFDEISPDSFSEFFSLACDEGKAECLQTLTQTSRFAEFSVKKLATNFLNFMKNEDIGCLQVILNCGRFHEIPNEVIKTALFLGEPNSKCVELLQKHIPNYSNSPKT
ncbi:MAG TPA: ankyrin repeat domain-containing protein [Rhabdochlamydiaceae bacterium]|nr:ankyrin repeat domain-containing protein [Rhabdochlamydiaceae bacterium]